MELVPQFPFIERTAERWWISRHTGKALLIEKSRRLVESWTLRGLELWAMGIRREKRVVTGLTYPKAAEHAWRIAHLMRELVARRPELGIEYDPRTAERGGTFEAQALEAVLLPNRSLFTTLNQLGGSFQGQGYSGVSMEEFSQYRNPAYMWSQAHIVTAGKAGMPGGHVVVITNAYPNLAWKEIKRAPGETVVG